MSTTATTKTVNRGSANREQDLKKSLKIKIDILKRLHKDYEYYQKEQKSQIELIERFKNDAAKDEYDVKKQEEILEENKTMIVDTIKRITAAITTCTEFMVEHEEKSDELEQWNEALELVDKYSDEFIKE
ncbi:tubulin folding cofactor A [Cavenderia fasciculata]|uniref:Tubulin-specific chaperone A n=1 Tax=Cavenderia fasciculata TaxID=261658 RepID=F4PGW7_CACFS|nr:tubulin folding cofactor A [Cavenderia fasciculata]EGG24951.1 tubulin folding cofactor A [Cavenderia fasciculata]|eukprot:XP_004362802.1 tubulin folding cofactor A [Cavenderia fasciculata]